MNVLIVEDNGEKLQAVARLTKSARGVGEVETAHDAAQAKRALQSRKFDVVILDIALPVTAGEEPSRLGGLELMEEVIRRPRYEKPHVWIGLTAHDESFTDALPRFASELWSLVQYDHTSDGWAQQILTKLEYTSLALQASEVSQYQSDLCIITALPDPELSALLNAGWDWSLLPSQVDGTSYYEAFFEGVDGRKRAIAAAAPQMGMTNAAVLAMKLIQRFVPRYLSMCGIAAGMRGACELGDVLCPDPCWDWGQGKFGVDGAGNSVFMPAPTQLRLDAIVRGKLASFSQDSAAWDRIRRGWPSPDASRSVLQMRLGPFASGAAVLSDDSKVKDLKAQHRQILGLDMEAYAVFAAAHEAPLPQPKSFVLKSVVDFADSQKGDSHRYYAAYTSARSLCLFAEKYL